jgi:hypothetical protein
MAAALSAYPVTQKKNNESIHEGAFKCALEFHYNLHESFVNAVFYPMKGRWAQEGAEPSWHLNQAQQIELEKRVQEMARSIHGTPLKVKIAYGVIVAAAAAAIGIGISLSGRAT